MRLPAGFQRSIRTGGVSSHSCCVPTVCVGDGDGDKGGMSINYGIAISKPKSSCSLWVPAGSVAAYWDSTSCVGVGCASTSIVAANCVSTSCVGTWELCVPLGVSCVSARPGGPCVGVWQQHHYLGGFWLSASLAGCGNHKLLPKHASLRHVYARLMHFVLMLTLLSGGSQSVD